VALSCRPLGAEILGRGRVDGAKEPDASSLTTSVVGLEDLGVNLGGEVEGMGSMAGDLPGDARRACRLPVDD